jgi:LPS-assembly protein
VIFDDNAKEVFAEGNVVLQDGEDIIECEKLQLNLITKMGSIEKGRVFIKKRWVQDCRRPYKQGWRVTVQD